MSRGFKRIATLHVLSQAVTPSGHLGTWQDPRWNLLSLELPSAAWRSRRIETHGFAPQSRDWFAFFEETLPEFPRTIFNHSNE